MKKFFLFALFFSCIAFASPNKLLLQRDLTFAKATDWDLLALSGNCEIAVDNDGSLFVLDKNAMQVYCFSKTGKYLYSFGKGGQGPGEFQYPHDLCIMGEYVCLYNTVARSVLFFDKKGVFKKQLKTKSHALRLVPLSNDILVAVEQGKNSVKGKLLKYLLNIYNLKDKNKTIKVCPVISENGYWFIHYKGGGFSFFTKQFAGHYFVIADNQGNFILANSKSSKVKIFNKSGVLVNSFNLQDKIQSFPGKLKKIRIREIQTFLKKKNWKFDKQKLNDGLNTIPLFQDIFVFNKNNLLFVDFRWSWDKGTNFTAKEYSIDGKFLGNCEFVFANKKLQNKINNLYGYGLVWKFKNNCLYIMLENDDNSDEPYYRVVKFNIIKEENAVR